MKMISSLEMNHTKSSLKHIAVLKLAVMLWEQNDVKVLTEKYFSAETYISDRAGTWLHHLRVSLEKTASSDSSLLNFAIDRLGSDSRLWQRAEDKVIEKVTKLPLPESLKKKLLDVIEPVGLEIRNWREFHGRFVSVTKLGESCLCWTQSSTVDKRKTAEALIKDEGLYITGRYILACIYCFESDVKMLWDKLTESDRKLFYSEKYPQYVNQPELVVFWTYYIKGEIAKLNNMMDETFGHEPSYRYPFMLAVDNGNKAAAKYFIQKLNPADRIAHLKESVKLVCNNRRPVKESTDFSDNDYTDVLCFILSQLEKMHQIRVLEHHSYEVVKHFLHWPWQGVFLKIVESMFPFISENIYHTILCDISCKVGQCHKDYNYLKLLGELWHLSPNNYKIYVINKEQKKETMNLLCSILKTGDIENIAFILKNLTDFEKENLIFCGNGLEMCRFLALKGRWNAVRFIVGECISSKEKMVNLKIISENNVRLRFPHRESENTWNIFFNMLDDFINKYGRKRSREEGTSNSAKDCSFTTSLANNN